jgi:phage baseplate assembly protein W
MAIWYGYNPPFFTDTSVMPIQQDARLIKNDLMQLLQTNPGERVMRSDIGSPIPGLLFESITDANISLIKADILRSVASYEPRVTIENLIINIDQNNSTVTITLFGVVNLDPSDKFKIDIGVSEGGIAYVRAA